MQVRLISITPNAEKTISYCARVSSPQNQDNPNISGLLKYCIEHQHWSVFEMANMVLEIETSRAISAQILRHRSFSFQEFSQRYAQFQGFEVTGARRQDNKNRQSSIDDMDIEDRHWWFDNLIRTQNETEILYNEAIKRGIAKEVARFILPMSTRTSLYMNGTIRSWIHYIQLRTANGTQLEHMEIAKEIQNIFTRELPIISEALGWSNN